MARPLRIKVAGGLYDVTSRGDRQEAVFRVDPDRRDWLAMVGEASVWPWSSYRAMVGLAAAPAWLDTDWLLRQFGADRQTAQAHYAAIVAEGTGRPTVWQALRHQVFLGSDAFVERFTQGYRPLEQAREVPRAQRRSLAQSLHHYEQTYPVRREAMARAFRAGVYTMQEILPIISVGTTPRSVGPCVGSKRKNAKCVIARLDPISPRRR